MSLKTVASVEYVNEHCFIKGAAKYNGITQTLLMSKGIIQSINRTGVGQYTVTFTENQLTTDYVVLIQAGPCLTRTQGICTVSSFNIVTTNLNMIYIDFDSIHIIVMV